MEIPNQWARPGENFGMDVLVHNISRSSLALHEISKEQSEFQKAAFQFFTFTRQPIECVERVEVIEYGPRSKVRMSYEQCRERFASEGIPTTEVLVFHGTPSVDNIRGIIIHGFKVGGVEPGVKVAHGSVHGPGVYTAIGPSTPQQYARGTNAIILAKGLRGRDIHCHTSDLTANSVCPNPDWIVFKKGCQVLPLYVVYFSFRPISSDSACALPHIHNSKVAGPTSPLQTLSSKRKSLRQARVDARMLGIDVMDPDDDMDEDADMKAAVAASLASVKSSTNSTPGTSEEEKLLEIVIARSLMDSAKSAGAVMIPGHKKSRGAGAMTRNTDFVDDDDVAIDDDEMLRQAIAASLQVVTTTGVDSNCVHDEEEDNEALQITLAESLLNHVDDSDHHSSGSGECGADWTHNVGDGGLGQDQEEDEELAAAIALSLDYWTA